MGPFNKTACEENPHPSLSLCRINLPLPEKLEGRVGGKEERRKMSTVTRRVRER